MTDTNFPVDLSAFFKELGLPEMTPEQKEKYTKQILEMLEQRIQLRMAAMLTEQDLEALKDLSDEQTADYLDSKGINIATISEEEGLSLREELLQSMSYASGIIASMGDSDNSEPTQ